MAALGIKKKKKGEETPAGAPENQEGGAVAETSESKKKKGGGGKGRILTIVLIIVLVASALFAGGVIMTKVLLPGIVKGMYQDMGNMNTSSEDGTDPAQVEEADEVELVATHEVGEMIVQLSPDENGIAGYVKLEVGVGFTNEKEAAKFEEKKMEIKDIILETIGVKTLSEVRTMNDQIMLKKLLASKITPLFDQKKNKIRVVFGSFLAIDQ